MIDIALPDIANLYDLLETAGRSFARSELKRISIFFPDGRRCDLELLNNRSTQLRYQKIDSPVREVEYTSLANVEAIAMRFYDDASKLLSSLLSTRSSTASQVFIRLYGAAIETPVIYRFQKEGQKFYKST